MTPITKEERERELREAHEYLADGGLRETMGFADMAFKQDFPKVQCDASTAIALCQLAAKGLALSAAEKRIKELEAENADLKISVLAFAGPAVVAHAKMHGLPEGALYPPHYDLLEKCGGRMTDFRRAALQTEEGGE